MSINYIIVIISLIMFTISIFVLIRYLEYTKVSQNDLTGDHIKILIKKMDEFESKINNLTQKEISKIDYDNGIQALINNGYSKHEIAKRTNKSIREIDLMLKLKKGGKS
ncbi:hypothetical protein SAMN05661008_00525 [Alkalithermobacter thermoalcaliphilus JW-YL-7 = DSM 7308]|uniref:Uncharacterized protein n=1 Tax=Alkalithermobacter thermoalcaliphilus JW-YL-7 = DSM 7308 TaxID=1121328 RepID=A0A150FQA0_CLOPD|nr:hypothetical protein JWYL7_0872 [[Clostridium] paradoxum JW-YL-7 = DSM 7308]SHK60151.1 hypothetical protein SAMN05661008_00525 [[Clostridium] paradoxum JW-YL-7 = DSM 7308]